MTGQAVCLGRVRETLLIPLYGGAVENRKQDAALRDTRAEEIVASIDYGFARFDNLPSLIGTGLNTPYERVDNGRAHWFDLDLPDVIELRRPSSPTHHGGRDRRFRDGRPWADTVAARSDGPYVSSPPKPSCPSCTRRTSTTSRISWPTDSPVRRRPSAPPAPASSRGRTSTMR